MSFFFLSCCTESKKVLLDTQKSQIMNSECNSITMASILCLFGQMYANLQQSLLGNIRYIISCTSAANYCVPELAGCGDIYSCHTGLMSVWRFQWGRGHPELKRRWLSCSVGLSSLWSPSACGAESPTSVQSVRLRAKNAGAAGWRAGWFPVWGVFL